jgi:hypothetical protein
MVDATISRGRMRDLARLGRSHHDGSALAGRPARSSASRRRAVTDAASIADVTSTRPRAASPRPGRDDLMASTIHRSHALKDPSRPSDR